MVARELLERSGLWGRILEEAKKELKEQEEAEF
jgi:hypothetical protein